MKRKPKLKRKLLDFVDICCWILFTIFWVYLWWWIVSEHSIYSGDIEKRPDPWWYMRIGVVDTELDGYYREVIEDTYFIDDTMVDTNGDDR